MRTLHLHYIVMYSTSYNPSSKQPTQPLIPATFTGHFFHPLYSMLFVVHPIVMKELPPSSGYAHNYLNTSIIWTGSNWYCSLFL